MHYAFHINQQEQSPSKAKKKGLNASWVYNNDFIRLGGGGENRREDGKKNMPLICFVCLGGLAGWSHVFNRKLLGPEVENKSSDFQCLIATYLLPFRSYGEVLGCMFYLATPCSDL